MAGYDQTIKIKAAYHLAAKDFFLFLKAVGRKYARPTRINYRYLKRGRFYITIDGSPGGIDALFQELILNRGLYYYICSIRNSKKKEIITHAIIPVFQQLLEERFQNPYSRFLKRHILGKLSQEKFIPGDFSDPFSHEYEVIFRKWDIGVIDDWNFIKDLDSFLTRFMLIKTGHQPGRRSPAFHILVKRIYEKGVGMAEETKGLFNKIHFERTQGLHRLKNSLSKEEISNLAFQTYNYFQYFDEFQESQKQKTEKLHGKRFRRIKYGDERWLDEHGNPYRDENGELYDWKEISKQPCHDCSAIQGQYHCFGCDVEQCPRCRGQFLGCGCKLQKDFD
ncbi:MAG: hypothetical protein ACXACF_06300 [Candidatus Hermodarchaeia archaeon]|jgi:hypothetical protein